MWMVRTTLTKELAPGRGDIVRFTAVNLDVGDPTPSVYPLLFEAGSIQQTQLGDWTNTRHTLRAWGGDEAHDIAASVYDAARGFLALGVAPTADQLPISEPDHLRIEIGDDSWVFTHDDAPAQAWAVLQAAMAVRELEEGTPLAA